MPYHFDYDPINRILRCRFEGLVTDEMLKECQREAPKYVALTAPRMGIADFSEVTSFEASPGGMREVASSPTTVPTSLPRVVVAPSALVFGMARMFEMNSEHVRSDVRVVRSLDEARLALGVENLKFEPIETA